MKIIYKINILLFSIAVFASCATQTETSLTSGKADITEIEDNGWFIKKYEAYQPTTSYVNTLKNLPANVQLLAFAGIWDEKSQKSLPEFYKIADKAKVADDQIVLYLLDENLKNEDMSHQVYNIESIPTYIILKDGKEIGRITNVEEGSVGDQLVRTLSDNEQFSRINNQ